MIYIAVIMICIACFFWGFYLGGSFEKWKNDKVEVDKFWVIYGDEFTQNLKEIRYHKKDIDMNVNLN